jgi:hypothetical protein
MQTNILINKIKFKIHTFCIVRIDSDVISNAAGFATAFSAANSC